MLAVSQEVQSRSSALLLRSLDNLHAVHVGTEDLDRHLNSDTGEFVTHEEGCFNSAQLDAENNSVEWVAVLECHSYDIAGLDTARVSSVVEHCLALTRGVEDCQLRFGNRSDGVLACFASGWRSRVDLEGLALYIR